MDKLDYKKEYKDLYLPPQEPSAVDVPEMGFFAVDGVGSPQSAAYQNAVSALYALSYTVKMSKKSGAAPEGYFEYAVPPLEGVWRAEGERDDWQWTSMIRQPEFVTEAVAKRAIETAQSKKPDIDFSAARFVRLREGLCVQMMHVGSYADEARSFGRMQDFCAAAGLRRTSEAHREIYLSDPRRVSPDKLRTVLRWTVEKV